MTRSLIPPGGATSLALAVAVLAFGSGLAGGAADAAAGVSFLAHQAQYDLSLVKTRGSSSINSARGRILYTFTGSACEGYTSEFRQVSELESGEGNVNLSDQRTTYWEDAEGKAYHFKSDARMNDADVSTIDGVAERTGDQITVKLKRPETKTFTLDGSTVFPNQQIRRIIEAAQAGKSILELTVYDGSENGEKVYKTLAVIGQPIASDRTTATSDPSFTSDALKSVTRWPVTVSYYDPDAKPTDGEQTPAYAMSFELFENGVARAMTIDYNDFVLAGAMEKFDVKDSKPCK